MHIENVSIPDFAILLFLGNYILNFGNHNRLWVWHST